MMRHKKQAGFTLIELLIYTTLTAVIVGIFGSILVTITRIQGQQSGSTQVAREINFLMSTISSRIRDSYDITSVTANEINLLTNTYPGVVTTIKLDNNVVKIDENGSGLDALTNNNITVNSLTFTQKSDATNPSSTIIFVEIEASNTSPTPQGAVTRTVRTGVSPLLQN